MSYIPTDDNKLIDDILSRKEFYWFHKPIDEKDSNKNNSENFMSNIIPRFLLEDAIDKSMNLKLTSYQMFVQNYINPNTPYKRLLLKWSTGSGKTIGALSIAMNFIKRYKIEKEINNQEIGTVFIIGFSKRAFQNELLSYPEFGFLSKEERFKLDKLKRLASNGSLVDINNFKEFVIKIKKRFTNRFGNGFFKFYGYKEFLNRIFKNNKDINELSEEKIRIMLADNVLKYDNELLSQFKNSLIICDEIHNVYNSQEKNNWGIAIQAVLDKEPSCRAVFASATPFSNSPTEIIDLLNLLLPVKDRLIKSDLFYNTIDLKPNALEKIAILCRGRISYIQDTNPKYYPSIYMEGESLNEIPYLKFIRCPMSKYHYNTYKKVFTGLLSQDSQYLVDFALENPESDIGLFQTNQIKDKLINASQKWKDKYGLDFINGKIVGQGLKRDNLLKYSTKYVTMLDMIKNKIDKKDGKIFIYHNIVQMSGVLFIEQVLINNGYLDEFSSSNENTICVICGKPKKNHKKNEITGNSEPNETGNSEPNETGNSEENHEECININKYKNKIEWVKNEEYIITVNIIDKKEYENILGKKTIKNKEMFDNLNNYIKLNTIYFISAGNIHNRLINGQSHILNDLSIFLDNLEIKPIIIQVPNYAPRLGEWLLHMGFILIKQTYKYIFLLFDKDVYKLPNSGSDSLKEVYKLPNGGSNSLINKNISTIKNDETVNEMIDEKNNETVNEMIDEKNNETVNEMIDEKNNETVNEMIDEKNNETFNETFNAKNNETVNETFNAKNNETVNETFNAKNIKLMQKNDISGGNINSKKYINSKNYVDSKKYINSKNNNHEFLPVRFVIAHSDIDKPIMEHSIEKFNSPENTNGTKFLILIGSRIIKESYNTKAIRSVFIMGRPDNIPTLIQIRGRAVRKDSHKLLPFERRSVKLYIITSCLPEKQKNGIDKGKWKLSYEEYKYKEKIAAFQVMQNIEKILHENAIDSFINKQNINSDIHNKDPLAPLPFNININKKFNNELNINQLNLSTFNIYYKETEINLIKIIIKRLFIEISSIWEYNDLFKAVKNPLKYELEINTKLFTEDHYIIAINQLIYNNTYSHQDNFNQIINLDKNDNSNNYNQLSNSTNKLIDKLYDINDKLILLPSGQNCFIIPIIDQHTKNNSIENKSIKNQYYILFPIDSITNQPIIDIESPYRISKNENDKIININNFISTKNIDFDYDDKKKLFYQKYKDISIDNMENVVCEYGNSFHIKFIEECIQYVFNVWTNPNESKSNYHDFYFKMLYYYDLLSVVLWAHTIKPSLFQNYKKYCNPYYAKDIKLTTLSKYEKRKEEIEDISPDDNSDLSTSGDINALKTVIQRTSNTWIPLEFREMYNKILKDSLNLYNGIKKKLKNKTKVSANLLPVGHFISKYPKIFNPETGWVEDSTYNENDQKYVENNIIIGYNEKMSSGTYIKFKLREPIHNIKKFNDNRLISRGVVCKSKSKLELKKLAESLDVIFPSGYINVDEICLSIRSKLMRLELKERIKKSNIKWFYNHWENNFTS